MKPVKQLPSAKLRCHYSFLSETANCRKQVALPRAPCCSSPSDSLQVPFLSGTQYEYFPIVATFIAGYAVIVLEEQTEINKARHGAGPGGASVGPERPPWDRGTGGRSGTGSERGTADW